MTPANTNEAPTPLWLIWPMAAYAASMDLTARQWAVWTAAQRAALNLTAQVWGAGAPQSRQAEEASPAIALAAADMRACTAAVWRAQMDAVDALRRSAA